MADEYKFGYIGVIDILGFGDFSFKEENYYAINRLMKRLDSFRRSFNLNINDTKIVIMSDTIFVLTEIDTEQKYDPVYFGSVLRLLSTFKGIINNDTKLFSRASITIGKYSYDDQSGILFGPGITRSVKLAEKSGNFISEGLDSSLFSKNPAALIVDNVFFKHNEELIKRTLEHNGTVSFIKNDDHFTPCGNEFYYYNTFYECFNDYYLTSLNEENFSKEIIFNDFCMKIEERFRLHKKYSEKYIIENKCFEYFKKNWTDHLYW